MNLDRVGGFWPPPGGAHFGSANLRFLLKKHAQSLKESGLDRLTVSLDSLNSDSYKKLNVDPCT